MKVCTITCRINNKTHISKIPLEKPIPEYILADEAWRVALLFAKTQAISRFGSFSSYEFGKFLEDLNYDYIVKEEDKT